MIASYHGLRRGSSRYITSIIIIINPDVPGLTSQRSLLEVCVCAPTRQTLSTSLSLQGPMQIAKSRQATLLLFHMPLRELLSSLSCKRGCWEEVCKR